MKNFLFINANTKQTVIKNTFWLSVSEVSSRLLKMALIIYAARVLGVNDWGIFSYALSLGSLLMIFADIGINGLITRELAQKKENHKVVVSTALFIKGIILLASIILFFLVGPYISHIPEAKILFPFIAMILFFDSVRDIATSINRAGEKMEKEMIVKTIMSLVILATGIFLLKINSPVPKDVAIAYTIGCAVGCIMMLIVIKKDIKNYLTKIKTGLIKSILKITWPFALISLVGSIMANTDIYMLGIWKDSTEIGLYASVQRIQQFILIIPSMIATASFPAMSRLAHEDDEQFKKIFEKIMVAILGICIPIIFGGVALADKIVPFIFGQEYIRAIPIFQILMLMLIASFPLYLLSNAIFAYNKQRTIFKAYVLGVIINVVMNLILIPKLGAVGSAISTLISSIIIAFIHWRELRKTVDFKILSKLKKIILSSIVMCIIIVLIQKIQVHFIVNIIVSSISYFIFLFLLKEPLLRYN